MVGNTKKNCVTNFLHKLLQLYILYIKKDKQLHANLSCSCLLGFWNVVMESKNGRGLFGLLTSQLTSTTTERFLQREIV